MVGKNNKLLKENKNNQRFLRFSLRKLSVGVVSVAIAAGFYIGGSQSVLADTLSTGPVVNQSTSNDNLAENTDKNKVNLQSSSASADSSAAASAADSTAAEAGKSAVPAAEQQNTATLNVAEVNPAAASNPANLLDNKSQSNAATVNDDDLLKNIKISNPTDPKFVQYQDLVDSYMSDHYGEEKPSQYVFSVIRDSRIDTDFIWTVDQDTGEKVSVYFNNWYSGITNYHQFINTDFDDNHNDYRYYYYDYRYSKHGVTLSYDKPEGSSGSISVIDDNYNIWDPDDANLQDVYEINGSTDNSRYDSFATTLPEKGQPIIKFLYRNPNTGKLMNLRDPIYYSNGLTGQKFELDIGDSYKQELKDMFAGFKLVDSSKASGTFTQFAQGKTYIEHDASDDSEVIYQQIDAEGTMKVFYREKDGEKQPVLDTHGNPCQLKAGSSVKIDTGNRSKMVYNPFVAGDHAYELIYEPEDQSANIDYVDQNGKVVKTDTVHGKTDETVNVTPSVPDHYELVPGQNIPSEVTLKDKNTPIIVKVTPKLDPVTDPAKLNKSISRTITINKPGEKPQVINQTADFTRTGQYNEVTGATVYTDWTLKGNTLEAVDAPAVPGYTPNVAHVDGVKNPTADTKLANVVINYSADDQTQKIDYVDQNGKVVKTDTVHGKTDETVNVTPSVPDHYELVPGQNIPSEVTLKDKNTPIIVKVTPKLDPVTDPAKLNKSISRTITINKPGEKPQVINQTADFTRTGQYNEVTGATVYTDWTLKGNTLEAVDAPAVPGYTPNVAHVDGVKNPTADTKLANVVINYSADDQTQKIDYVDQNGKVVKTDTVHGKTDETVNVTPSVPDHYELVPGQNIPSEVTLKDKNTPIIVKVTPKLDPVTDPAKLNKSISRTITINKPGEKPQVINQTADFTRTGQYNEVTGATVYTDWTLKGNTLEAVDAPAVPGYTPNVAHVDGVKNPTADTKLANVVINYSADDQTQKIDYVDQNGKVVKTDTVHGKTDETVNVTPSVPDHYELVPGQNIPSEVTLKDKNTPIIVKVTPKLDPVTDPAKLNKSISRTITINKPGEKPQVINQTADFTRTGQYNEVTGATVYTDWTLKGNTLEAVDAPAVPGYTPNVAHVDGVKNPTADTKLANVVINYSADDQTQKIDYVDQNGKVVKTDTVHGKTDETVNVTPSVPDHYELVPGQNIPSEVTLKDKNTPIIVKVTPKLDPVTDPAKLNKSISRTITINKPGEKPQVINQTADFTRTGQYNEVTGATVYTDWTLKGNTLEAVDAPAVPGYTPNVAHVDGVKNPTADTKLANVVINYSADDQTQKIDYVDQNGKVVKTDTVHGKTDETVNVTPSVPDHYELVPGQNIPSEVTLKDKNTPIIVKVTPKLDPVTDPAKLNKSISRTITINKPGEKPQVINQTADFTRTGQYNEVTGATVYTDWTLKGNTLEAVDAPAVPGYTPNVAHVDGVKNPTADTKLANVVINYSADDQTQKIDYVDQNGKVVKTDTVHGKTDETVNVTPSVPDHYELVPGQNIPSEVTLKDKNTPIIVKVTPKLDPVTDPAKLNKSISRTITINKPGEKPQVINQTADFTRTGQYNEVTGATVYTDWTLKGNTLEAVDAPAVPGYTPNVAHVDGVKNPTADTKLANVVINYSADDQTQKIDYVDQNGKVVKTDTVHGKTDETVNVTPSVPDHYELVPGQNIPSEVTLKDKNTPIIVKVTPKLDPVTDPAKLNKSISRTITINKPGEKPQVINQTADFTRTGQYNEVTGATVYTDWTLKGNTLEAVDAPAVPGYTPNVAHVDGVKNPTADTKLANVVINYSADDQTQKIDYVDQNGKVVKTDTVHGKTDETVNVTPSVPDHYELVPGQNIPSEVTLKDKNTPIIVKVTPKLDPVTDPAKLNKSISRTITINKPGEKPQVINQTADFTRTGQYNEVTGATVYTDWTLKGNTLEAVDAPAVPGYTPNVAHVDGVKNPTADTKLANVVINYSADDQTQKIDYVDQNGKVVKTDTVHGKTDETVNVTPSVPDHYELVPGQNIPSEVTLKDKNTPIIVKVTPKLDPVTDPAKLNKSISRTITINKPGEKPQVINQTADFTRTGQYNEVTGATVYTDWTLKGNTLEAVDAPAVPGYTPNVAHVDGVKNPTADTKLANVVINYSADDQTQKIDYVDQNGKVVKTDTVHGKTDETVNVTPSVPDHYELVPGQNIPSEVTLKDKNTPIIVKVTPKLDPVTDPAKLNKSISRTITINKPGEKPQVINQTADFTRTGQYNEVTGATVYTDWTLKGNTLEAVDAPAVPGYTPNVAHVDGVKNPTADTKLANVVINYSADDQTQKIDYVDQNGKVVKTDTVHGKTDETVNVTPSVPDHYELVPGQNIPSEVTLKDKNTPIIVKVTPKLDPVTDPAKLNKSISRTITINKPGEKPQVINQTADFTRTGQYNEVTGATVYTDWTLKGNTLEAVDAPAVPGYTPNVAHVDGVKNPTADTKLANVVINYSADDQTQKIDYVDQNGKVVKTDTVHGKTDETVNVTPSVPDHYELVPGQNIPSEVTLKDKNTPIIVKVTPKLDPVTDPAKLNKSISRTITINKPGEKPQVINQTADFTRTGKTNEVTGITTYTPWVLDQNGLTTVSAPEVPGYTPSQKTVASVDNPTTNTKLTDVTINYTANSQTTHINYVDKDGETVKSDTVSGKTDETVKTNSEVPAGWKITDGQIPETIHFTGEETPDTTITIEHDTTSVDHIKPVKPGDKTPSGKVIDGAHESDLNQTITRTINVTTPDGQTTTTKQVAKIFRDATIDDVTGEVTYGSWSEDTWADFKPGQLAGYTASQADVPAVTVKDGQKDQTVDITYTANEGTVLIKYVDRDGNEIGQQVITGHVGDTIKVTPQFPENWVPVDPDTVPAEVQIKEENGQIIIVVVRHDEKDPVQTKKVTRTIMVTTPDGQTKTIKQVVTISRYGNLDLVTGQIAWQPWTTAQWDVFKPAAIAGYIPSLAEVPAVTVDGETTDQTVDITYAAVATPAQPEHQAPTASDTPDAQQATNQKADSNAQPAVTVVTSQQTATAQQAEFTTNSRRLPQTGNSHDASALAGLGLASLMGLLGLGGKRRKRD